MSLRQGVFCVNIEFNYAGLTETYDLRILARLWYKNAKSLRRR